MSDIVFEEPPAAWAVRKPREGFINHGEVAAALADRPGEWALIKKSGSASAARAAVFQIRRGVLRAYAPEGSYEAVSRVVGEERRVYARYVGEV